MEICIKGYKETKNFGRTGVDEITKVELIPYKGDFFGLKVDGGDEFMINGHEFRNALKALGFLHNMVHVHGGTKI